MQEQAIEAENVHKSFGKVKALAGVDLAVEQGTILALLGPNGAGKTTLVRILTTLLTPDSGQATVSGFDVVREASKLRAVIGLAGQYAAIDEVLTGQENLELVGTLYHLDKKEVRERTKTLLKQFELDEAATRRAKTYSGGMRRRLDLAASLLGRPNVLFLDEPTTGLDPASRFTMWRIIKGLVKQGVTILLTTQYMEEADNLANKIAVIDRGKIIAQGTANQLKSKVGGDVIEVHLSDKSLLRAAVKSISQLTNTELKVDEDLSRITMSAEKGTAMLAEVIRKLDSGGVVVSDIFLRRPTLDDVFLALTGHYSENSGKASPKREESEQILWRGGAK